MKELARVKELAEVKELARVKELAEVKDTGGNLSVPPIYRRKPLMFLYVSITYVIPTYVSTNQIRDSRTNRHWCFFSHPEPW
jgi:hypothetical protein